MLYNLIVGTLMTIMLWLAIRGIIWQKKHPEPERGRLFFHLVMAAYIVLENCLSTQLSAIFHSRPVPTYP